MADAPVNVLSICGSLRKNSFNAALQRTLPSLAPPGLSIKSAPAWADTPRARSVKEADPLRRVFTAPPGHAGSKPSTARQTRISDSIESR